MQTVVSVIFRLLYFVFVLYATVIFGIPIGMGFDTGINLTAIIATFLYLFTFIPALGLAFTPVKRIKSPPLILKIWYSWLLFILVGFPMLLLVIFFVDKFIR